MPGQVSPGAGGETADPTGIDHPATILRILLDLGHGLRRSDRLCCVGTTEERRTHYDVQVISAMVSRYCEDGLAKSDRLCPRCRTCHSASHAALSASSDPTSAILVTKTWENEMSCSDDFTEDITTKCASNIQFGRRIFLSKAGNSRIISHYRANEVVYSQGDAADSAFYIQDGTAKVTVYSERGKEAIVWLPRAGDFFGEGCLAGQESRQATVSTRTECVIVRFAKASLIRAIREEPAFAELFISHLVTRNIRVQEDLVDHLFNSSEKRLARVLLSLTNFDKEGRLESIPVKISQEMLAEMIGTTRARVSFFMNKFRKLGFVDYKRHIEVHASLFSVLLNDNSETQTIRSNINGQLSRLASATDQLASRRSGAHLLRLRDMRVARADGTRRAGG